MHFLMESRNTRLATIALVLAVAVGFGGGFWFAHKYPEAGVDDKVVINQEEGKPTGVNFGLFWQVWESLNRKYVDNDKISFQKLVYGAIAGMVESVGDPYTVFLEPQISK